MGGELLLENWALTSICQEATEDGLVKRHKPVLWDDVTHNTFAPRLQNTPTHTLYTLTSHAGLSTLPCHYIIPTEQHNDWGHIQRSRLSSKHSCNISKTVRLRFCCTATTSGSLTAPPSGHFQFRPWWQMLMDCPSREGLDRAETIGNVTEPQRDKTRF